MQSLTKVSAGQTRSGVLGFKRRWIHGSLKRQTSIMMPAMSPLMTEGTITQWKKREGEAFVAGEVLLRIQSDFYAVDVEAQSDGILGKILMPDGSTNVPVEQVIALVARNSNELTMIQNGQQVPSPSMNVPTPPALNALPDPPSVSINPMSLNTNSSPRNLHFSQSSPLTPTMASSRTPSLFEKQTMSGYSYRTIHTSKASRTAKLRVPRLEALSRGIELSPSTSPRVQESIPSPFQMQLQEDVATTPLPSTPLTARWPGSSASLMTSSALPTSKSYLWSASFNEDAPKSAIQLDGDSIRRMIVSNLTANQPTNINELEDVL
ncbi:hypothetical protein CPB83DRAFT_845467 [Crepidotus variabilis]|uniref:Lipoyl-binding domain-containing protein n=1 Tax=Crepidotus variabilis TaxID=179855 RepID=A0A9P6EQW2_9AGAR|nr:hypothetical protein CPB83DRAFT_845467 [Crepidotus variabilis]